MISKNKEKQNIDITGLYCAGDDAKKYNPFPYDMAKIKVFMQETGKSLEHITYDEIKKLEIK